jgi:hypothetical protein
LKITTSNNEYLFDTKGEIFRDTPDLSGCHLKLFEIRNNIIGDVSSDSTTTKNEITFFDAPFKELFPKWIAIDYHVQFETWIQYSKTSNYNLDLKPILKFNWELEAKASQKNQMWVIDNANHSSVQDINNSIHYFSTADHPLLPCELRHLGNTVREFSLQYDELRRDCC